MSHEVETMAFANQVPWHGLGNRVDASVSVDEMLVAAGLDWDVKLHPMFAHLDLGGNAHQSIRVKNKSALVRSNDNKVLTTASDNWKPIQNREMLEFFKEYAFAGGATLETAGSLRDGKLVWGLANLGHGFTTNNGADAVKGYLLFASPHEVGKATTVRVTGTRVVCANTMAIAMRGHSNGYYSQSHLKDFNFDLARETVGLAHEAMVDMEKNAKVLEALELSDRDTVAILGKHFQPDVEIADLIANPDMRSQAMHEVLVSLEQAPGAVPGNAWGVLNAVTFWSDHVAGRSADARLNKAWFGTNAKLKLAVERDLLEMAA